MKRTWTIVGVNDVRVSFEWYQSLFGQPDTAPEHDDLANSSTQTERFCSASTPGARTSTPR